MRYDEAQKRYIIDDDGKKVSIEDLGPAHAISQDDYFAQQHQAREAVNAAADTARAEAHLDADIGSIQAVLDQRNNESYPTEVIVANHGDPVWDAIWQTIKGWDIQRERGMGYSDATGDDVQRIFDAIRVADPRFTNQERTT